MKGAAAIAQHFHEYQKVRFPVVVLGLSFLPAVLSSGAVVGIPIDLKFVVLALAASVAYLLHIRIIDEFRDYEHDLEHHKDRPIPRGVITLDELNIIDWLAVLLLLAVALYASLQALLLLLIMLLYSYAARKEFFFGWKFRKHFYLYNAVNLVQMLLLQVLVYTLANPFFSFTALVTVHFFFTASGTVIFEFLRKVRSPGHDGTGHDTYTWFLGIRNALALYALLVTANIVLFVRAMLILGDATTYWALSTGALVAGTYTTLLIHIHKRDTTSNLLMQLAFMVMYGCCNIILFLSV